MNEPDRLRQAAKVLHGRAAAATPGPYVQNGNNGIHTPIGSCVATTAQHDDDRRKADAVYLHGMHPGVGVALADWLDAEAHILYDLARVDESVARQCAPYAHAIADHVLGSDA